MNSSLPIVDLEGRPASAPARDRIAARIDRAFQQVGFCYLAGAGVPRALVDGVFAASARFHAQPAEAKSRLAINAYHRGYIAPSSSLIRSSSVARVTRPNRSESLMLMHEVAQSDPDFGRPLQGPNQWPDELPGFRASVEAYEREARCLSRYVTRLLCRALGLADEHLDPCFERPTTWLRLLHYPPSPADAIAHDYGAAPHTDYGFITVLAQDTQGGLEVRTQGGDWIAAPPIEDTFVLNVADMLDRWSDRRWPSTPHRVRNRSGKSRYSVAYFYDPSMDTRVEPLPTVAPSTGREPVIFGQYVMERLDRNYDYRNTAGSTGPDRRPLG